MDKKEFILWLSLLFRDLLLCLVVQSITTILTITLEKKTQISRFQFKKFSFFCQTFYELSHRIANDFVNKTTIKLAGESRLS